MPKNIQDILQSFAQTKALVVGDVILDTYLEGQVERISPEAPVPVVDVKRREARLGGAANVALNISSLGAKVMLCSLIGEDMPGKALQRPDSDDIYRSDAAHT